MHELLHEAIELAAAAHIGRGLQITSWNLANNFVVFNNQVHGRREAPTSWRDLLWLDRNGKNNNSGSKTTLKDSAGLISRLELDVKCPVHALLCKHVFILELFVKGVFSLELFVLPKEIFCWGEMFLFGNHTVFYCTVLQNCRNCLLM